MFYIISTIQNSAINFVNDFKNFEQQISLELGEIGCFTLLHEVLVNPSKEDIQKLGQVSFYDLNKENLCKNIHLKDYIFNWQQFYCDYYYCPWHFAFCKNVFGVTFVAKIFEFLGKIVKK